LNVLPRQDDDHADVARLLTGDPAESRLALERIHERLRDRVCGWIRTRYPGLSPDDLADVWSETLLGVLRAARKGRFDNHRPLVGWIMTIAYRRAADLTRRSHAWRRTLARLRPAGEREPDGASATLARVRAVVGALPGNQRLVMAAFIDGYPDTRRTEDLRGRIRERLGIELTADAVKSALREARRKIRRAVDGRAVREGDSR
jgi:DNA-directed RNA polymerase specialized sigma24 family protein